MVEIACIHTTAALFAVTPLSILEDMLCHATPTPGWPIRTSPPIIAPAVDAVPKETQPLPEYVTSIVAASAATPQLMVTAGESSSDMVAGVGGGGGGGDTVQHSLILHVAVAQLMAAGAASRSLDEPEQSKPAHVPQVEAPVTVMVVL